jgi:hypothetical protein
MPRDGCRTPTAPPEERTRHDPDLPVWPSPRAPGPGPVALAMRPLWRLLALWAGLAGAVPVPGFVAAVDPLRGPESPGHRKGRAMHDHTCNAWCAPPRHAHLVLIDPACCTEADVLMQVAEPYKALWGRTILSARLAPEADREAAMAAKIGATPQGSARGGGLHGCPEPAHATSLTALRWRRRH